MTKSHLEETFAWWLNAEGMPPATRELRFAPPRRWRFDFAWPDQRVAVEIEGLTRAGGRHQTIQGFEEDAEKYEAAMAAGWRVYRVPGGWVAKGRRLICRPQVMEVLRGLLEQKNATVVARQEIARMGGLKGGPARAAKLSPEKRREIARKAAQARWSRSK